MSPSPAPTPPTLPPLSPLHEAELDWDTVDALFADLAALAEIHEIRLRPARGAKVAPGAADAGLVRSTAVVGSLEAARVALRTGAAHGAQIRYVHDQVAWCDTLLVGGGALPVRLVRVATELSPSAEPGSEKEE
jgi:hypothetical protein